MVYEKQNGVLRFECNDGYGLIQGSRFIKGRKVVNIPEILRLQQCCLER